MTGDPGPGSAGPRRWVSPGSCQGPMFWECPPSTESWAPGTLEFHPGPPGPGSHHCAASALAPCPMIWEPPPLNVSGTPGT